jgi:hypothetical protein
MQEKFYCRSRKLLIAAFAQRKHLIRWDKSPKKDISLQEIEILEQKLSLIMSDIPMAKFITENFERIQYIIPSKNGVYLNNLNDLYYHANEILNENNPKPETHG